MHRNKQQTGRPRDTRVDAAITAAVIELLEEVGYTGLTVAAVAERAGIGKASIYRRYAGKHEMAFAAIIHGRTLEVPPDTGSLLGDLTALARVIVGHLTNPGAATALMSLLGEAAGDPALASRFTRTFVEPERAGNAELLERAVRRGELARMPDVDLFHAMFGGTVMSWLFICHHDPHDLPERLARFACAALLSTTTTPAISR
ncbi:AcrR family transcriptional regulator [Thermocatellispora tengchongensis]|uniref:AcrR family transcriptional regulator n=2 Tax=Thermocatellispora tengchongensis TaxID=1073253 RepID=A0A840PB92_9ACTN|nr:TetR/AcrR family transcriptional regulator [Thermocatellispora tengchongensis]MBB5136269.1 AcrR family transcriptional regulator [Thermocatellispora tengchongensis]